MHKHFKQGIAPMRAVLHVNSLNRNDALFIIVLCVPYVLAFLATTAPPYRPLHHIKPSTTTTSTTTITTTTTTTTITTTTNTTSTSVKPPVKHSIHTSVHHPPTSSAAAAARPDRVKDISRSHQGPNEAQAKTGRDQSAAAAAAAAVADPSKSSSDSRYASNQAATAVQSSK